MKTYNNLHNHRQRQRRPIGVEDVDVDLEDVEDVEDVEDGYKEDIVIVIIIIIVIVIKIIIVIVIIIVNNNVADVEEDVEEDVSDATDLNYFNTKNLIICHLLFFLSLNFFFINFFT